MEAKLTPDQIAFVREAVRTGRLKSEEDAVAEALALWERRERVRAQLLSDIGDAEASVAAGKSRVITRETMMDLADEVKWRGRARLAAEQPGV